MCSAASCSISSVGHALREAHAQDVRGAQVRLGRTTTPAAASPSASRAVSMASRADDRGAAPFGHHLHADRRHLHGDEVVALAHVEAPRIADVVDVREVDILLGAHRAAPVARLLQRNAVLVALGDIQEGAAVGTEQPLVGREDHEVRIERAHVERQHAGARAWHRRAGRRPARAARGRRGRGRPRRRRTSAPRRSRRARAVRHRDRSIAVSERPRSSRRRRAGAPSRRRSRPAADARHPFQHGRGMVVLQHQHARARRHGQHLGRRRHAVGDRRDERDVARGRP